MAGTVTFVPDSVVAGRTAYVDTHSAGPRSHAVETGDAFSAGLGFRAPFMAAAGGEAFSAQVYGEDFPRLVILASGVILIGNGSAYPSVGRVVGSGSPEGVLAMPVGSEYFDRSGGTGTTHYVKESGGSGNTGWVAK